MDYDFTNRYFDIDHKNVIVGQEDVKVIKNIIPFRREGSFYCLSHTDEGFVNGTWAKGGNNREERKEICYPNATG